MPITRTPFPTRDDRKPVGVTADSVAKSYGSQQVLRDVSFEVEPGEIFVIMGPSGSGKSVLLRLIAGLEQPSGGTLRIGGQDPTQAETRNRFALALVFQSGALFNSMTLYENVALPLQEHTDLDPDIIDIQVKIKLELVGLREHADTISVELTYGR